MPAEGASAARDAAASGAPAATMRIARAMAQAGLCSRRDAERWVDEGRVRVNGRVVGSPALNVGPLDRIEVDGNLLPAPVPVQLWRYHKPRGRVTTHRDPEGRPTVFEALPAGMPRVISIGRLDFNTEGLLLLTTSGDLARHLELPSTGWLRRYRVRVHGRIDRAALARLADGVTVDGVRYGPIEVGIDDVQPERGTAQNHWLSIGLREGKNREVRNVLSSVGLEVNRLIRISYGPFQLGDLAIGGVEEIRSRILADQLGAELSSSLGLAPPSRKPQSTGRSEETGQPGEHSKARARPAGEKAWAKPRPPRKGTQRPESSGSGKRSTGSNKRAGSAGHADRKPGAKTGDGPRAIAGARSGARSAKRPFPGRGNRSGGKPRGGTG